ncbi:hypothetical protein DM860_000244 [Cuscuta australis]|uniref:Pectinesterase inhibitor domain-containing protein n=1 Tax=Cuscuta australis TaxID=267555 RepID=A0A328CY01_9ASTE|nr:hypothetical protein DM860_000244 [Cuscuta australis]
MMDSSSNESITISILHSDQPHQKPFPPNNPKTKKLNTLIFLALVVLVTTLFIAAGTIITSPSSLKRNDTPRLSASARYYYCNLTPHDELCFASMSSTVNATSFRSNPALIFSTALRAAFDELNNTATSLTEALDRHLPSSNARYEPPSARLALSRCRSLVHNSMSRVNESAGLLGVDSSSMGGLTFEEADAIRVRMRFAARCVGKCLLGLKEVGGEDDEKMGVEKAHKHIVNVMWLFRRRESILRDFYGPPLMIETDHYYNYPVKYRFLVCMYSLGYLFISFLYCAIWRSK